MKTAKPTRLNASTAIGEILAAATATGEPVKRVQLLPIGPITARDGRKWRVRDAAHAQSIVDASKATAGATDLPIDYDHQLVYGQGEGKGGRAAASGWMRNLSVESSGIWADVEWTAAADAKLRAKEYRYISPFFGFDQATGDITRIFHAGLTNFPAITELAAVASSDLDGDSMDRTALAAALGLAATATDAEIVAAATAAHAASAAAAASLNTLALAAGLKEGATVEAVAAAVTAARTLAEPDPKAYVPMAAFKELQGQVRSLQDSEAETAATAAVDAATAAGKITPAGRDHALKLYKADPAAFAQFVGAMPTVITQEARMAAAAVVTEDGPLSPEAKAICSAMGLDEAKFKAAKAL